MSEDYVKDTQGDIGRELGTSSDHSALMEMDNFIWEDVSDYIAVKRLLSKVSNNIVPVSNSPKLDMDAKSVLMSKSASAAFISKVRAKHQWYQAAKRRKEKKKNEILAINANVT